MPLNWIYFTKSLVSKIKKSNINMTSGLVKSLSKRCIYYLYFLLKYLCRYLLIQVLSMIKKNPIIYIPRIYKTLPNVTKYFSKEEKQILSLASPLISYHIDLLNNVSFQFFFFIYIYVTITMHLAILFRKRIKNGYHIIFYINYVNTVVIIS